MLRRSHRSDRAKGQAGYVTIIFALSLAMLLGFVGLAVDTGYLQYLNRQMQTAADAGAVAAGDELSRNCTAVWDVANRKWTFAGMTCTGVSGNPLIVSAAKNDAAMNGFTDGSNGVTVTVNNPPASGFYAGQTYAVEVIVSRRTPLFFLGALGIGQPTTRARAVSHVIPVRNCIREDGNSPGQYNCGNLNKYVWQAGRCYGQDYGTGNCPHIVVDYNGYVQSVSGVCTSGTTEPAWLTPEVNGKVYGPDGDCYWTTLGSDVILSAVLGE